MECVAECAACVCEADRAEETTVFVAAIGRTHARTHAHENSMVEKEWPWPVVDEKARAQNSNDELP